MNLNHWSLAGNTILGESLTCRGLNLARESSFEERILGFIVKSSSCYLCFLIHSDVNMKLLPIPATTASNHSHAGLCATKHWVKVNPPFLSFLLLWYLVIAIRKVTNVALLIINLPVWVEHCFYELHEFFLKTHIQLSDTITILPTSSWTFCCKKTSPF